MINLVMFSMNHPRIFTLSLLWVITEVDEWEVAPRFLDLLAYTDVQFIQDRVKLLHPSYVPASNGQSSSCAGTVQLESDLLIEYDWY